MENNSWFPMVKGGRGGKEVFVTIKKQYEVVMEMFCILTLSASILVVIL